jgi:general secretion pathway protein G
METRGFTLIELLVVVAIIGILAAIAIPYFFRARNRARQKRSMADMRTLAAAIEQYGLDETFYPKVSEVGSLAQCLEPTYLRKIPRHDGWNNPFYYQADLGSGTDYTLASLGMDGVQGSWVPGRRTTDYDDDIVISDGQFVQWPEGMQK